MAAQPKVNGFRCIIFRNGITFISNRAAGNRSNDIFPEVADLQGSCSTASS